MAHWAEINGDNVVIRVLVGNDSHVDEGYQWLVDNLGGRWIKTSINTAGGIHKNDGIPLRKNYAGIGYLYDEERDAFIPPQTYTSWVLNEETCLWESPVAYPADGKNYLWNEDLLQWEEISA